LEAVTVVALAIVPPRPLRAIAEPAACNPVLNSVMIFAQAQFKVTDRATFGDALRMAQCRAFDHHGYFRPLQLLSNLGR